MKIVYKTTNTKCYHYDRIMYIADLLIILLELN
jgi:hypothetical protein